MKKCLNCDKDIPNVNKYCNNVCQNEYQYKEKIQKWKDGTFDGIKGKDAVSSHIRKYLFLKFNDKCCKCGWGEINEYTNLIPLQVHHLDGNCLNNIEDNLELICPNCHSLTENYGSRNKNSARTRS